MRLLRRKLIRLQEKEHIWVLEIDILEPLLRLGMLVHVERCCGTITEQDVHGDLVRLLGLADHISNVPVDQGMNRGIQGLEWGVESGQGFWGGCGIGFEVVALPIDVLVVIRKHLQRKEHLWDEHLGVLRFGEESGFHVVVEVGERLVPTVHHRHVVDHAFDLGRRNRNRRCWARHLL